MNSLAAKGTDPFVPAHDWQHIDTDKIKPGKAQVISSCSCGVAVKGDAEMILSLGKVKIVRTYVTGGYTWFCPVSQINKL